MYNLQQHLESRACLLADSALSTLAYSLSNLIELAKPQQQSRQLASSGSQTLRQYQPQSDIYLTNTFDTNAVRLRVLGLSKCCHEINRHAAILTRDALSKNRPDATIAGCIGPTGATLNHFTAPMAIEEFAEQAFALAEGGVDLFWLESMPSLLEAQTALNGCRLAAPDTPAIVTVQLHSESGTSTTTAAELALGLVDCAVIACGPEMGYQLADVPEALHEMRAVAPQMQLAAQLNSTTLAANAAGYMISDRLLNQTIKAWVNAGASIIGTDSNFSPNQMSILRAALDSERESTRVA